MSTKKSVSSLVANRRIVVAIAACLALLPAGALNCASASTSNKIAILYDQGGRGDHALNDAVALGVDAIKKKFQTQLIFTISPRQCLTLLQGRIKTKAAK